MTRSEVRHVSPTLTVWLAALLIGCGGSDTPGEGPDGTGASRSQPGDASGGAPSDMDDPPNGSGGHGADGTGGSSSGGSSSEGEDDSHCEPGDFILGPFLFSGTMTNCFDWDPGDATVEFGGVRSIALPTPTVAGQPYALSFAYLNQGGDGTLEYYATDGECGPVIEKLSSETMRYRKLICTDTVPSGNYQHLVMVWNNLSASLSDGTFCPNVTCGD